MKDAFGGAKKLIAYGAGMAGWSTLINTISVMLIYFYIPPVNSGLPPLIPQISVFGFLTIFSLILASGRLFDAITDPLIAWFSDRFVSRWGRRVPFLFISVIPSGIFSILLFFPPYNYQTSDNYIWIFLIQLGLYFFMTVYIVPFNALMPELARNSDEKMRLSVVLSLSFVFGIIIASQIPLMASLFGKIFFITDIQGQFRLAIIVIVIIAIFLMFLPLLVVNEARYCDSRPARINLFLSLKTALSNKQFIIFIIADSSFFITLAIISSGLLYYVKVLLGLEERAGSLFLSIMIFLSLAFYPLVVRLVKKNGKKKLIIISFVIFSLLFLSVIFMGRIPVNPKILLYSLAVASAFPVAVLGILPYTIIAEITDEISEKTGYKIEGMFFAVRAFANKVGQTMGVMIFAILILLGKDPGNDFGIRISALVGMVICLFAAATFYNFRE
ncbi:MAG: MFS transporter [Bacteroidales bacterium]|nr:MFS transporter [Bacteroidales bacterium]MCF8390409.1 MFS transporter [Bacteroidales bacterium]